MAPPRGTPPTQSGAELHDAGLLHRAKVVWVGMPPMQSPGLSAAMANLDSIYQADAAKNPAVTYLSSLTILGTPQGQFTPFITANGQEVNIREPDGTHISRAEARCCHRLSWNAAQPAAHQPSCLTWRVDWPRAQHVARAPDHPAGRPSPRVHERWGWSHDGLHPALDFAHVTELPNAATLVAVGSGDQPDALP